MSGFVHESVPIDSSASGEIPVDLREWLSPARLLALAIGAAGVVTADSLFRNPRFEKYSAPMLLALLSYCYASNNSGSGDIEWEISNDPLLHNFCSSSPLNASAIRRCRRAYRPWLLQCLMCLLEKVIAERAEKGEAIYTSGQIVDWASRKIQLAILMDASAAD